MPQSSSPTPTVAVIGAGPYGLSAVAHLRDAGVPTVAFGDAMAFWREGMPGGMLLRSSPRASSLSDPRGELSLSSWAGAHGRELGSVLPLEAFLEYGSWFKDHVVPDLDPRSVERVREDDGGFELTLCDGERARVERVVVAAGLHNFARTPTVFADLPATRVSHACANTAMEAFSGQSVAVIGLGQSALEGAALLYEAGARVEVLGRRSEVHWLGGWSDARANGGPAPVVPTVTAPYKQTWRARTGLHWRPAPTEVGGRVESWLGAAPDVLRHMPRRVRAPLTERCVRPAGARWLPDRLREVNISLSCTVVEARELDGRVRLLLDDGSERWVDHVLLGTGYEVDVRGYPFLDPELSARLRTVGGSPILCGGFESSLRGLHFVGAPSCESFGPVMRFVVGTAYAAPTLTRRILGRRGPTFRWAF
jgi:cation diffusion facilitator CzcD-associated flavoprotein CzcO